MGKKKKNAVKNPSAAPVQAAQPQKPAVERPSVLNLAKISEAAYAEKGTRAPYNFVPFHARGAQEEVRPTARVLYRYDSTEELPRHDVIDPNLKTGEIHVTLTAETPVFISDGNEHFYKGANGQFMIPGSTIRGMVRENMQILGFGAIQTGEDVDDTRIYFRDMTSARGSVTWPLKQYYDTVLNVETRRGKDGKSYSIPKDVKAGYLRRDDQGHFTIQPVKGEFVIRVPQKNAALREAGLVDDEATTIPVAYQVSDGVVTSISTNIAASEGQSGTQKGVLLYTGPGVGKKNSRYLFPEADEEAAPIDISEEDVISYKDDYKARENSLGEKRPTDGRMKKVRSPEERKKFWALQEGEDRIGKPVFYVKHNGHIWFGMTMFLRIGYLHSVGEGLPIPPKEVEAGGAPLDYPHAVLGYIGKKKSYRTRVTFGDFPAEGNPEEGREVRTILGGPKASWLAGYVVDAKDYNDSNFTIRGWKQYWLKEPNLPPVPEGKEKVGTGLRPLPKGTKFSGVIRYKNLHEDELGLLLWALRLEEGCKQTIGMAKPYGYGRMNLEIDDLREYDMQSMYTPEGICGKPTVAPKERVAEYISKYDAYACSKMYIKNSMLAANDDLQDFFFIHTVIRNAGNVSYMALEDFKNVAIKLPTIRDVRKEYQEKADAEAAKAENKEQDLDSWLAAFKQKTDNNRL